MQEKGVIRAEKQPGLTVINENKMEIKKIKVMRGPNCWSATQHRLIVLQLEMEACQSETGAGADDFLRRLDQLAVYEQLTGQNLSLPQLICHVAVTLQCHAGMPCSVFTAPPTALNCGDMMIFPYTVESAGIEAAYGAIRLFNTLKPQMSQAWETEVRALDRIRSREGYGPSTQAIANAAAESGIPVSRLDDRNSMLMLGYGANQRIVQAAVAGSTSSIAVELAQDKDSTKAMLSANYIPVPAGIMIDELSGLAVAIKEIGFPLVVKPADGNHGRGITTMIGSLEEAVKAFHLARQVCEDVIIEKHVQGDDYRLLVIDYKLVAAAKRLPAMVTGDGVSTIAKLIQTINNDPLRGSGHDKVLTKITIDEDTESILAGLQLTTGSILPKGMELCLKSTANISTGGTAEDVTDKVHPDNKALAERIARLMDLDICGIDIMATTISEPITAANGAVLEVNAGPGLRMHLSPSKGMPNNVAVPIVEMLYPPGKTARIPLVAITGTNGKTTTTRLIAHLAKQAGYSTGFTTTDGIYINDRLIQAGDCSGPQSARVVLRDPIVDFAVLECARGGILRSGLGFDECGVGIVTNISSDHLGLDGIDNLEQLARVKAVVPRSAPSTGYAILNADDDLVYAMKDEISARLALFSLEPGNPRITSHIGQGKLAAVVEDGWFVLCSAGRKQHVLPVADVPLTFNGTALSMIKNILPAMLAAFIYDIPVKTLQDGLLSFKPSAEHTPGRMNEFDFEHFRLMIDYAHNEGGYQELKNYAGQVTASVKVGVIAATGDRRDQDIRSLGSLAAQTFDELIIRHDKDGRGRTDEEITSFLLEGIHAVKPGMVVKVIPDEIEAINYVMQHAQKDAWIFVNTDNVHETLAYISRLHENAFSYSH